MCADASPSKGHNFDIFLERCQRFVLREHFVCDLLVTDVDQIVLGHIFDIFLERCQRFVLREHFVCDLLVTDVDQIVQGPVSCPPKYIVLKVWPFEMANLQGLG